MGENVPKVKILLLGEAGVGKTSVLLRYAEDVFSDQYKQLVGEDFKRKFVLVENKQVPVEVWDTGGQERFRTITSSFYRGAQGALFMYEIQSKASFEKIALWMKEVEKYSDGMIKVLVGNKTDLESREVPAEEAEQFAKNQRMLFFEVSAKTGEGVDKAFLACVTEAYKKHSGYVASIPLVTDSSDKRKKTCVLI